MDAGKLNEKTMETLWRGTEQEEGIDRLEHHSQLAALMRRKGEAAGDEAEGEGYFGYAVNLAVRRAEIRQVTNETVTGMLPALAGREDFSIRADLPDWETLTETNRETPCAPGRAAEAEIAKKLKQMEKESDAAAMKEAHACFGPEGEGKYAVVLNPYPIRRAMFTCIPSKGPLRVFDGDQEIQAQFIGGDGATAVELEMDGFSMQTLRLEEDGIPCETVTMAEEGFCFDSEGMHVEVMPDGRIIQYHSRTHGNVLAAPGGNILEAELVTEDGRHQTITGQAAGESRIERGPLFDNVLIEGRLGDSRYTMIMYLPKCTSQRIEIMTELYPSENLMRAMERKGSEIRCVWNMAAEDPDLAADGPLGASPVRRRDRMISANGCTLTADGWGALYDHQGITRSRFENGRFVSIWAEGGPYAKESLPAGALDCGETDPAKDAYRFFNAFDLTDTADPGSMFSRILYYQIPMFPLRTDHDAGSRTLFSLKGRELIYTSMLRRDGRVYLRMWNATEKKVLPEAEDFWKLKAVIGEDGVRRTEAPWVEPGEFVWLEISGEL